MNWTEFIVKPGTTLLTGAVTGLVVAFYTARYALKRFYHEKWWEKRLAAFMEVTEYAYKIKRAEDYWYAQLNAQRDEDGAFQSLSSEDEEVLLAEFKLALKELTRISHLAPFTLSPHASYLLAHYICSHDKIYPSWWEDEIDNYEATEISSKLIDELLVNLILEAKNELLIQASINIFKVIKNKIYKNKDKKRVHG